MYIEHFALWVHDLEGMKSFYARYFGAIAHAKYTNATKHFSSYFLTFPDGNARLELMQMPGVTDLPSRELSLYRGYTHLAVSVGSEQVVNDLTETFRRDGFRIVGEPRRTGDGYYESIILDPENNRIELTA